MSTKKVKTMIEELLAAAGIDVNGQNPWDLQVYNDRFFSKAFYGGSLEVGESYVDKWWDRLKLDEFYNRVLRTSLEEHLHSWESLKDRYDEKFYRMWNYYLLSCAGSFRARKNQLWQIVLSRNGVPGGYVSVR